MEAGPTPPQLQTSAQLEARLSFNRTLRRHCRERLDSLAKSLEKQRAEYAKTKAEFQIDAVMFVGSLFFAATGWSLVFTAYEGGKMYGEAREIAAINGNCRETEREIARLTQTVEIFNRDIAEIAEELKRRAEQGPDAAPLL